MDLTDEQWAVLEPLVGELHRRADGHTRPRTQDGRPLRRYKRHWKVEHVFARLGNFHRLVVRSERHALTSRGFIHLGCVFILLRHRP